MITTFLIFLAVTVLSTIVNFFPVSSGFPQEAIDSVSYIGGYIGMLDPLVPVSTMFTILGLIIALELSIFGFRTLRWLFSYLPFIGGRSS